MPQPSHANAKAGDVEKVGQAIQALGQNDLATARQLLLEVVANTPRPYTHSYQKEDKLHVHFWDQAEFLTFVTAMREGRLGGPQQGVLWLPNAYPRAYYYLAYIDVEQRQYASALENLQSCLELEPDQPVCFIEIAMVHAALGKPELAVAAFDKALLARPYITAKAKATALRGKGIQLIELKQLDLAEACLNESLQYDPSSQLARNELKHIARLRSGQAGSVPMRLKPDESAPDVCARCGTPFFLGEAQGWKVGTIGEKLAYLCPECQQRHSTQ